mmetsp:Transcript_3078/g.5391  ORF Transcript_3078/g.5391 Transcript_3078/m.5391 type:complete len:436 (+) Transcript_3078:22-1329(+)
MASLLLALRYASAGKLGLFSVIILLLTSTQLSSAGSEKSDRKLNRIWKRGLPYAAELHSGNYTSHVVTSPREFPIAIFFTARSPKYGCTGCPIFEQKFQEVAQSYMALPENKRRGKNEMAFVTVAIDDAMNAFQNNQFTHVPRLYVLPPMPEGARLKEPIDPLYEFDVNTFETKKFLQYLKDRHQIVIPGSLKGESWRLVAGAALALLWGLVAHRVTRGPGGGGARAARGFLRSPRLWLGVSLACYAFGVSGSVYCVIRNPPKYISQGVNFDRLELVSGGGRDQYVYEGLLVGAAAVAAGLALAAFAAVAVPPRGGAKRWLVPRAVAAAVCLAVAIYSAQFLYTLYVKKTRWYSLGNTLPEGVKKWLGDSVKKGSGWAKRLLRLSEYFLFEYKDTAGLWKKTKVLVVGYALRWPWAVAADLGALARWLAAAAAGK